MQSHFFFFTSLHREFSQNSISTNLKNSAQINWSVKSGSTPRSPLHGCIAQKMVSPKHECIHSVYVPLLFQHLLGVGGHWPHRTMKGVPWNLQGVAHPLTVADFFFLGGGGSAGYCWDTWRSIHVQYSWCLVKVLATRWLLLHYAEENAAWDDDQNMNMRSDELVYVCQ